MNNNKITEEVLKELNLSENGQKDLLLKEAISLTIQKKNDEMAETIAKFTQIKEREKDLAIQKTREEFENKLCKTCGFDKTIERIPIILSSNPFSYAEYLENECEECHHQKDGTTIPVVYKFIQEFGSNIIRRKDKEMQQLIEDLKPSKEKLEQRIMEFRKIVKRDEQKRFEKDYKEKLKEALAKQRESFEAMIDEESKLIGVLVSRRDFSLYVNPEKLKQKLKEKF